MYYTKAALYKSPQWQYEKEWRLFLNKNNSIGLSSLNIQIKPVTILFSALTRMFPKPTFAP